MYYGSATTVQKSILALETEKAKKPIHPNHTSCMYHVCTKYATDITPLKSTSPHKQTHRLIKPSSN